MEIEDYKKDVETKIREILENRADIGSVEIEGTDIVIYTKNQKPFFDDETLVSKLAIQLKKKVKIRTSKNQLLDEKESEKIIREIVPEDAQIKTIYFEKPFSEVVIDCLKPGLVIGKQGTTLKEIITRTGWTPHILRTPAKPSKTLEGLRFFLSNNARERRDFLREVSERIYRGRKNQDGWVRITSLGGFKEVGRSCIFIETPETKILLDCGMGFGEGGEEDLPLLEILRFPVNELDAVVLSHAHMDHSGALPYLFKLGFRGPIYCTEATRDLMALLHIDYIKVAQKEGRTPLYQEEDVKKALMHCVTRNYNEVTDIAPDIKLTFFNAAHILGSTMIHLHFGEGNHNLLYSGDIKFGFTRLFEPIKTKFPRLETLILESTYGGSEDKQPSRKDAEENLIRIINEVVEKGGNVLIPVFAVGRGQEVMLTLEEFDKRGRLSKKAKIYADGMTKEASAIHTVYPEFLRKNLQRRILHNDNPFTVEIFRDVEREDRDKILEDGGAVILATSGMMVGGPVVEYFNKMAHDPKNCLLFVGFQAERTQGRRIQNGLKEIIVQENGKKKKIDVNLRIETVEGFSGHSDRNQLVAFVGNLQPLPKKIIVNHGEKNKVEEFAKYITKKFRVSVVAPQNLDSIRLR